ncbi:MAG: CYTH domain-containing protein [Lachnospiraceae bacterium]|nr:CYTH domain-containing protein [Lachnospiraceae bacterium]
MEIERKYLIKRLPEDLDSFPSRKITQGYICTDPVVRIRKDADKAYLTCKGKGLISREEINLPVSGSACDSLMKKAEGYIITKRRYIIPIKNPVFREGFTPPEGLSLKIELDIFEEPFSPLILAEVEFPDRETADAYVMEDWFSEDVSLDRRYHNSFMSEYGPEKVLSD